jgi:ParB-like chromosome segregation protein Spo0J
LELDEETALAILFTNLKGRKRKDYISTAKACRFLIKLYGSCPKVAEKVGVSSEIIREFDSLNDLPEEVQKMVAAGTIRLDTGYRISTKIKGEQRQIEIAKAVAGLGAFDARAIIEFAQKNPDMTADQIRSRVLESKTRKEKIHVFILPLTEDVYKALKSESNKRKISSEKLIEIIIKDWLKQQS